MQKSAKTTRRGALRRSLIVAGRKASAARPWEGDAHLPAEHADAWEPIAPSDNAFGGKLPRAPRAMTLDDIRRVREDYVVAARRAADAGFKWLVLHFAHGYLAQSFFSPLANSRCNSCASSFTFSNTLSTLPQSNPIRAALRVN